MKYLDLFNELQMARDYYTDEKTGASWRYHYDHEARRVYIEAQETKTAQDWFFNFLILPKKVKNQNGDKITVPYGFYLQACAIYKHIIQMQLPVDYDIYFVGWSQGGATIAIAGFLLAGFFKTHLIIYGTPAFCLTRKNVQTLLANFASAKNFVYTNDWIFRLIPGYKRPECENVHPNKATETLDQRHRVYGHCTYFTPEF